MGSHHPSGAALFYDFAFPGLRFAWPGLFSGRPSGTKSTVAVTMALLDTPKQNLPHQQKAVMRLHWSDAGLPPSIRRGWTDLPL
jgi:hypothetical protein